MPDFLALTAAHEPVIDAFRAAKPTCDLKEIGRLIETHVRIDADGAPRIVEADGSDALDRDNAYQPHTPTSFVASLRKSSPHLFDASVKPSSTKPSRSSADNYTTATLSEIFIKAGQRDPEALEELNRRARGGDGSPAEAKPNITELMMRSRQGDIAARNALDDMCIRKN